MKSLQESLFDNNISKDITFGDLFKLDDVRMHLKKASSGWKSSGRGWRQSGANDSYRLEDLYDYKLIAKDSKVSGSNPEQIVYNGLIKLIEDIPIQSNMTNKELNESLYKFNSYYKPLVTNTKRLHAGALPYAFRDSKDLKWNGDANDYSKQLNEWTILDVNNIRINLCCIEFKFKRR